MMGVQLKALLFSLAFFDYIFWFCTPLIDKWDGTFDGCAGEDPIGLA